MNMNDYKNAVGRMHMRPELKEEIIETSVEKGKNKFSERAISITVTAAICLSVFTVVFGVARVFKDTNKLTSNNSVTNYVPGTSFSSTSKTTPEGEENAKAFIKEAVLKQWDDEIINDVNFNILDETELSDIYEEAGITAYSETYAPLLETGNGFLSWGREEGTYYEYQNILSFIETKEYVNLFSSTSIEGLNKNACIKLADSYIKKLGLIMQIKNVYTLNTDTLIKSGYLIEENGMTINPYGTDLSYWTSSDQDCYLIVYDDPSYGLPMNHNSNEFQCSAVVGRNGLAFFNVNNVFEVTQVNKTVNIQSSDKAAQVLCDYWKNSLGINPDITEISKNCRLVYVAEPATISDPYKEYNDNGYVLRPYWEFKSDVFSTLFEELLIQYPSKYMGYFYENTLIVDAESCIFEEGMNFELNE